MCVEVKAGAVDKKLRNWEFWLTVVVHGLTIIGVSVGVASYIGKAAIHSEFERAIYEFHTQARPAIEQVIDAKILAHEKKVSEQYSESREDLTTRLAKLEEHAASTDARLERIENKLDRLLERR